MKLRLAWEGNEHAVRSLGHDWRRLDAVEPCCGRLEVGRCYDDGPFLLVEEEDPAERAHVVLRYKPRWHDDVVDEEIAFCPFCGAQIEIVPPPTSRSGTPGFLGTQKP